MSEKANSTQDEGRVAGPSHGRDIVMDQVRMAVKSIRYGEVRVIIQDGVVVQIERVEKQRFR